MAKKAKSLEVKYAEARQAYRKNQTEATKKKFLAVRQEYIEQRQLGNDKPAAKKKAAKKK